MRKLAILVILTLAVMISGCNKSASTEIPHKDEELKHKTELIRINEVLSKNENIILDKSNNYSDYIELYNYGEIDVDLSNYMLFDNNNLDDGWNFPNKTLKPNEYVLVFASGENIAYGSELHTNFKLKENEVLILAKVTGETVDTVIMPTLEADTSYGYTGDGYAIIQTPTPNFENDNSIFCMLEFSLPAGIYDSEFQLNITTSSEEAKIYYTTDGSEPTNESYLYDSSILITNRKDESPLYAPTKGVAINEYWENYKDVKFEDICMGTVIKAKAFLNDTFVSDTATGSYFVGIDDRYTFPIIALSVEPNDFFSEESGIYVIGESTRKPNFRMRGAEYERKAFVEFFGEDGTLEYSQNLGAKIYGGFSRSFPNKSIKLTAKKEYGANGRIKYPVFEGLYDKFDKPIETFNKIVFRNGGNDYNATIFRDVMMTSIASDLVDVMAYTPRILFINGEYWGIYNIREVADDDYIYDHYGVKNDDILMYEFDDGAALYKGEEKSENFNDLLDYLYDNSLESYDNYEFFKSQVDIENFLNYYIIQCFYGNEDWPNNNTKVWRKNVEVNDDSAKIGHDGKWRFIVYDLDLGFSEYVIDHLDNFIEYASTPYQKGDWNNEEYSSIILGRLFESKEFKNLFINRMMDLINTRFSTQNLTEEISYYSNMYKPNMEEHLMRYRFENTYNMEELEGRVNDLYSFAKRRPKDIEYDMADHFRIYGAKDITISLVGDGYVVVNDFIDILKDEDSFECSYFNEVPITLTAIGNDSAKFIGWSGDIESTEKEIEVNARSGMNLTANFE